MSEWQPIETAPMDGTNVLLWDGVSIEIGCWNCWGRDTEGRVIGLKDTIPSRYQDHWVWMSEGFTCHPTQWMPLPEPPK